MTRVMVKNKKWTDQKAKKTKKTLIFKLEYVICCDMLYSFKPMSEHSLMNCLTTERTKLKNPLCFVHRQIEIGHSYFLLIISNTYKKSIL